MSELVEKGDKRFSGPDWQQNPLFDVLKQSYLLASTALLKTASEVQGLDENTRRRLAQLDDAQAIEVGRRLRKLKPEIAPPWTADEVLIFMQMRERSK